MSARVSSTVAFGSFELDPNSGELRKDGLKIHLADQPLQILRLLLEHPGEIVTREELQHTLWSSHTFVEFEHSINAAVKRLREAVGDSAENPRFIETIPRRGYRFIAPVGCRGLPPVAFVTLDPDPRGPPPVRKQPRWALVAALLVIATASYPVGKWLWQRLHASRVPIHTIAVLPLVNLSRDPSQEYFSDGMTEALITQLGQIRSLRVISRQSVMRYKGTTKTVPQIAGELNADALVEGSALREGDKVRISAQLIRANPEEHLWARSYERQIHGVLELQAEVAQAIVTEIKGQVTPEEQARLVEARTVDPAAYDAFLKGSYELNQYGRMEQANLYFQQAVAADPGYAPAYVGLSHSYILLTFFASMPPAEAYAKAETAANTALRLDRDSAEAYLALARIKPYDGDWTGAETAYQRAIERKPNSAWVHSSHGFFLSWLGRFDQALQEIHLALELDRTSVRAMRTLAITLYYRRQYDQALAELNRAIEIDPDSALLNGDLGRVYVQKHMYKEAIASFERAKNLAGGEPGGSAGGGWRGHAYALAGQTNVALQILDDMKERSKQSYVSPLNIALIYAGLGDNEQTLQWLQKGFDLRDGELASLKVLPDWDPVRSDPRFQDLLHRMNFPQ